MSSDDPYRLSLVATLRRAALAAAALFGLVPAALAADTKRIASLDEVQARRQPEDARHSSADSPERPQRAETGSAAIPATEGQEKTLYALSKALEILPPAKGTLSKREASQRIDEMKKELGQA